MRAPLIVVALFTFLALSGATQPREAELEWTRASAPLPDDPAIFAVAEDAPASPALANDAPLCVPVLEATSTERHVALTWTACPGATRYEVWRGPSAAELVPLVVVNHASHVDRPDRPSVYAVRAEQGPLSNAAAIAWGS